MDVEREVHVGGRSFARVAVGGLLIVLVAISPGLASDASQASVTDNEIAVEMIATGLELPVTFAITPGGRILFGERFTGEIRMLRPGAGTNRLVFTVQNLSWDGDQGLLGLALDPHYPRTRTIYAFASRLLDGRAVNQILRIAPKRRGGAQATVIYSSEASFVHNGGRIAFGPDGKLYAFLGEHDVPANAQNPSNHFGKVLRMTSTGRVPRDNPSSNSYIYAYGFRNSFGMTFDPTTGTLWETENGPDCNDELNRVVRGGNYGWGEASSCDSPLGSPLNTNQAGDDVRLPRTWYTPTTAPTGIAFCSRCGLGEDLEGHAFFGEFNTGRLRALGLGPRRIAVSSDRIVYHHNPGCLLSMEVGPGGAIYFSDCESIYRLVLSRVNDTHVMQPAAVDRRKSSETAWRWCCSDR
jgi:glucose/arabinose dehydrogenase